MLIEAMIISLGFEIDFGVFLNFRIHSANMSFDTVIPHIMTATPFQTLMIDIMNNIFVKLIHQAFLKLLHQFEGNRCFLHF